MRICVHFLPFLLFINFCYGSDVTYYVTEEKPAGTFIGNIANDSNLSQEMSDPDFSTLRYSFLSTGDNYVSLFTINQTTGTFYTADVLDRETLCPFSVDCKLSLEVAVQSSIRSFFRKIELTVYVEDVNDHSPIFTQSSMTLSIPESTLVGTSFTIFPAKDADTSEQYSLKSYELEETNVPFNVSFVKNFDGTFVVKLVVRQELDREVRDSYRITVVAKDGGSPPRTDKLHVTVNVSDVNDHAPMMSSSIYDVTIKETVPAGTVILTLRATDLDIGKNAEIRYRLSPHQSDSIKSLFGVDEFSGNVSVLGPLPYNFGNPFKVIVEATDMGDQPLTTQAFVMVAVEDSGNSAPKIHINLLTTANVARVSEHATIGAVVAHVVVVDQDSGLNGVVSCSIESEYFTLQRLDVKEFKVTVSKQLDREKSSSHTVAVRCQDTGSPPLSSRSSFLVEVIDINDHAPHFNLPTYSATIKENNAIHTTVIRVTAHDMDEGSNANVSYKFLGDDKAYQNFKIDSHTGIITANSTFDREKDPLYILKVIAVDEGVTPLTGTATVSVIIADENDQTPHFLRNLFIFRISEKKSPGTIVGRLMAVDNDYGDNGKVVFSGATGNSPFIVNSDGIIKTSLALDREKRSSYDFPVYASDLGSPSLSSAARVNIFIADTNDNSPTFDYPTTGNNSVDVSYETKPGTIIAHIRAHDPDEGQNGEVSYRVNVLSNNNNSNVFQINIHTGDLIAKTSLDQYAGQVFHLHLSATDRGNESRTSRITMLIRVSDTEVPGSLSQSNLYIVITFVTVTVVVSAAIIVTIVLIRWWDSKREHQKKLQKANKPFNGGLIIGNADFTNGNIRYDDGDLRYTEKVAEGQTADKRQKEVTFSLDKASGEHYQAKPMMTYTSFGVCIPSYINFAVILSPL